jgi:hypothetical protein
VAAQRSRAATLGAHGGELGLGEFHRLVFGRLSSFARLGKKAAQLAATEPAAQGSGEYLAARPACLGGLRIGELEQLVVDLDRDCRHGNLLWDKGTSAVQLLAAVADCLEGGECAVVGVGEAAEVLLGGLDLLVAEAVHHGLQIGAAGQ